jgi:hypothetical protein
MIKPNLGQRWRHRNIHSDYVVEIIQVIPNIIVHVLTIDLLVDETDHYIGEYFTPKNLTSNGAINNNWEYLQGQDKIKE